VVRGAKKAKWFGGGEVYFTGGGEIVFVFRLRQKGKQTGRSSALTMAGLCCFLDEVCRKGGE
jgi:hypothetical protein